MAYQTCAGDGANDTFHHPQDETSETPNNSFVYLTNLAGGVLSLALIAGVCVWGYKLMMRDVTGIPIVRSVQGDMRVAANWRSIRGCQSTWWLPKAVRKHPQTGSCWRRNRSR